MKLLILHFRPKHLYPPLLNILDYFQENELDYLLVTSAKLRKTDSSPLGKFLSIVDYFLFTVKALYVLFFKANKVMYFESISVLPVVIYKKIFRSSKKMIVVHYHEYFSQEDYQRQSFFERTGRKYEIPILQESQWISHTNQDRLELFKKEFPNIDTSKCHIMPNYPSRKWQEANSFSNNDYTDGTQPIRLVYIGALSFTALYLDEVFEYFGGDKRFSLDFYSRCDDQKIIDRIANYDNFNFKGSIDYNHIIDLKGKYDVGLVLYTGKSLNYKFNAPNKIFEYLALDLDVWCSDKLLTAHNYVITKTYPKMLLVDFENLESFNVLEAISRKGKNYKSSPYICEEVYASLLKKINENTNS